MENYSVYIHKFPNNRCYVGITRQDPKIRWGYNGSGYKKQPVYSDILFYGWDNIEHIIIDCFLSAEEAQTLEKELIKKYDSINNGYNISSGGGLGGDSWCEFEYGGIIYSAKELAEMSIYDLNAHDITNRINEHKWSIEKAINTPKGRKNILFDYNGNKYTIKQLYSIRKCRELTCKQIRSRLLRHNWDVERAISQPNNIKQQPFGLGERIYEYKGKMYNSYELLQLSNIENLTVFDITDRINHHGWSIDDAISKPKRKSNIKYEYNGKYYTANELVKLSKIDGIKSSHIRDRIKNGHSVEYAITTPIRKREK